jgi:hypothetical protein
VQNGDDAVDGRGGSGKSLWCSRVAGYVLASAAPSAPLASRLHTDNFKMKEKMLHMHSFSFSNLEQGGVTF